MDYNNDLQISKREFVDYMTAQVKNYEDNLEFLIADIENMQGKINQVEQMLA